MTHTRGENRLISLVEKAKYSCQSIAKAVRNDLKVIDEARDSGMKWGEIADGLGFPGKEREIRKAYSREKGRQEKKGDPGQSGASTGNVKAGDPRPPVKTENGTSTTEEGTPEKKVHLIGADDSKDKNLFERSKLY